MTVLKFGEFLNEAEINDPSQIASQENLDQIKKEVDDHKLLTPKLKPLLALEPEKAQEEFKKLSNGNTLLAMEWEMIKTEDIIKKAQETIKVQQQRMGELIKQKEEKLKNIQNRLNSSK